jgi:hypothetical protein
MVEFIEELRHYCRYPRCRMKLPKPVSNDREAFCSRGCYRGFYRSRCLICEGPLERRNEAQRICSKRKCRRALRTARAMGRYYVAQKGHGGIKSPDFIEPPQPVAPDRGIDWAVRVNSVRIIAPKYVLRQECRKLQEEIEPPGTPSTTLPPTHKNIPVLLRHQARSRRTFPRY